MPSSMSANNDEVLHLTNDDIETLYDIVQHAQTLPGPPFRALFKAYDHVRAQKNKSDDGSRYFTFLLRMQEDQDATQGDAGLVERFQRVLGKMGIRVEVNPDGVGVEVTQSGLDRILQGEQSSTQNPLGRIPSRRGSFDSFFDGAADKVAGTEYANEGPQRSRRPSGAASDSRGPSDKRRSRSDTEAQAQLMGQLPIRSRVNGYGYGARRTASGSVASRPRRPSSVSSRGSLRIHRDDELTGSQQFGEYDGDDSEQTDSFDRSHIQIPGVNAPIPDSDAEDGGAYAVHLTSFRPSQTQIIRDAETFDRRRVQLHNETLARTLIQRWRHQTDAAAQESEQMEARAVSFDRNVLLRASLESWRVALQTRRQLLETERFFDRLEGRAEKARNLFLLTKAFTHWAKSAEDEVQRTSTATRHILRTKYFNAWRDITTVNELKIQHFILAKFLDRWRTRTAVVWEQNNMAVELYEHNIVYRLYWQWFYKFCDRRAPIFYKSRLARDMVKKWAEIVQILKERESWAAARGNRQIVQRAHGKLREKAATVRSMEAQANEFRQRSLLSFGFSTFRRQAQLVPLSAAVSNEVGSRLVRSTFHAWHRDTNLSHKARNVDRLRVIRNAFTAWNDRLRIKAVEERIDDRVQLQCLYKWALASRVSLFQRIHDHRIKQSTIANWIGQTQDRETRLGNAERRFADFKKAQMLRIYLRRIEDATVQRKNLEYQALSVYEPKCKQRIFDRLLEKHKHCQQLDEWAERANYYVTMKNAIKRWQTATEFARRNRRREMYTQVRRTIKMNLVRRTFRVWRDKAANVRMKQRQADEIVKNCTVRTTTALLARWHDRTVTLLNFEVQAVQSYNTKLRASTYAVWTQQFQGLLALNNQATALRQESIELGASACLKKLGWRVWNLKRREDDALALHQRNFEKHLRAMIRFWWDQTQERIAQRPESPTPSSRMGRMGRRDDDDYARTGTGYGDNDGDVRDGEEEDHREDGDLLDDAGDETRGLEAWTAFDENALGLSPHTNLDLSFTLPPTSQSQPPPSRTHRRPTAPRPHTQPPTSSVRPPPIQELPDLEDEEEEAGFWASTPMAPPTTKAGYLKTPSKRSVARAKRPELPASPEKHIAVLGTTIDRTIAGAASAPPAHGYINRIGGRGVTSFERRLREGGFSRSGTGASKGRGGGRGRVTFGDLER